jgi:hypothetical protein
MNKVQEKAQKFFEQNPEVKKVYGSSDGFLFTDRGFCQDHAATLEDKSVETIVNGAASQEDDTNEDVELTNDQKVLLEDLSKASYNTLKELAKVLKLETADQKQATLLAALEAYKAELQ